MLARARQETPTPLGNTSSLCRESASLSCQNTSPEEVPSAMWEGRAATAVTACSLPRLVRGGIQAISRSMGAHSRKAAIRERVETKLLLKLDGKETTAHPHPVDVQPHLQENSAPTIDLSLQQNQFFYLFFFREMSLKKGGGRLFQPLPRLFLTFLTHFLGKM